LLRNREVFLCFLPDVSIIRRAALPSPAAHHIHLWEQEQHQPSSCCSSHPVCPLKANPLESTSPVQFAPKATFASLAIAVGHPRSYCLLAKAHRTCLASTSHSLHGIHSPLTT